MQNIGTVAAHVVDVAVRLHRELGPGLVESVYETVLAGKLTSMGHKVARQRPVDIEFEGVRFVCAFRIDLVVDDELLVEIKSVERLNNAHMKQLLTYLRLTNKSLGLLFNFGEATLREGLRRVVNDHNAVASSRLRVNQSSGDYPCSTSQA